MIRNKSYVNKVLLNFVKAKQIKLEVKLKQLNLCTQESMIVLVNSADSHEDKVIFKVVSHTLF